MAKFLRNRSTKEIIAFLEAHFFKRINVVGDDAIYEHPTNSPSKEKHPVKVTLNQKSTPIGTMDYITSRSGYKKKYWINWWKDNGYGE